jgi:hypothetical protein
MGRLQSCGRLGKQIARAVTSVTAGANGRTANSSNLRLSGGTSRDAGGVVPPDPVVSPLDMFPRDERDQAVPRIVTHEGVQVTSVPGLSRAVELHQQRIEKPNGVWERRWGAGGFVQAVASRDKASGRRGMGARSEVAETWPSPSGGAR